MTIMFNRGLRNLYAYRGIFQMFSATSAITIYKGTQPAAASITSDWTSYNSASTDYLAHYVSGAWTQPMWGPLIQLSTLPPALAPTNTGMASWAIVWDTNVTQVSVNGTTLPSVNFLVVPVSDPVGKGVIRFTDPNLTAGVSVQIQDGSIGTYYA